MKRTIQALAMLIAITLAVIWIVGCGEEEEVGPSAALKSVEPPTGSTVPGNVTVKITLDNPVKADTKLTVNGVDATGAGASWTWTPPTPLAVGPQTLKIEWTNPDDTKGSADVSYTVTVPDVTPPAISSSTPKDKAKDQDPEKLNADGMEIKFSEPLKKVDVEVTIDGEPLKWLAELLDDKTTVAVTMLKGGELPYEAEVILVVSAEDLAGIKLEKAKITFTTAAKEE